MYLVFIAMLAMNMDKEVLSAFGLLTEELKLSNTSTSAKNDAAYEGLNTLAQEQAAKYLPLKEKADKIKSLSSEFYSYLEDLKSKMTEAIEDITDYTAMDKPDFLDEYFFRGDGLKPEGQEFVDKMNNFRTEVSAALGGEFKDLEKIVADRFNTDQHENKDGKMIDWLDYRYKGYPLVASLTNLTQIQYRE
jgi:gliding motility-associated protein GldM